MSENTEKKIGTKRIMDVPVIEELDENSYVLVNNNGEAAQISGSKVGGGGGELPILGVTADYEVIDYNTKEPIDFATGLGILSKRPVLKFYAEDMPETMVGIITVLAMDARTNYKYINAVVAQQTEDGPSLTDGTLTFSDTEME